MKVGCNFDPRSLLKLMQICCARPWSSSCWLRPRFKRQISLYSGARFQHLLRSLPCGNWRGGISVVQGVGWRQSRACGNAPRLARTRPFAICSLSSYLMTLPHWDDARRGQQRRRPRGILRPTASRSLASVLASHSSTISLRRTLKSASQTQGVGSYLRASGLPKSVSHSNGRSWKGRQHRPSNQPLALCV